MQRNAWDMPEPPSSSPSGQGALWFWLAAVLLVPVVVLAAAYVPIPIFYSYLPGPVRDIDELVGVDGGKAYSSEGSLLMTTVTIDTEVTAFEVLAAAVDDDRQVVLKSQVTQGGSLRMQLHEQREAMRESKRHAMEVAFSALGLGRPQGDGAEVVETIEGYPAERVLRPGDVIVAIEGERVATTCDVGAAIDAHEIGRPVEMVIRRDGVTRRLRIRTVASPHDSSSAFIGVAMRDVNYRFEPPFEVDFKTGEIAGPSAGLMMALALYDRLTPEDLTRGRAVAGTGTIACDGGVGAVGGIQQKVAGAEEQGADIFLSPAANAAEARRAADELVVVAVSSFDQAIEHLEKLDG